MITRRPAAKRGRSELSWLDSRHSFSFADYYDPEQMGFRALRVINEDRVLPGTGFPMHPHRDMEILTYVLAGAVEHRDSMGNATVVRAGELQRMTAGTGVRHSEVNPSPTETLHLLQIWIVPERVGLSPTYEQQRLPLDEQRGRLVRLASRDEGPITLHQDVTLYGARLGPGDRVPYELARGRHAWIQVARGALRLGELQLEAGDGAAVSDESEIALVATEAAEILLFDLA